MRVDVKGNVGSWSSGARPHTGRSGTESRTSTSIEDEARSMGRASWSLRFALAHKTPCGAFEALSNAAPKGEGQKEKRRRRAVRLCPVRLFLQLGATPCFFSGVPR